MGQTVDISTAPLLVAFPFKGEGDARPTVHVIQGDHKVVLLADEVTDSKGRVIARRVEGGWVMSHDSGIAWQGDRPDPAQVFPAIYVCSTKGDA